MVKLYSNNCPKCRILKDRLDKNKIEYVKSDNFLKLIENDISSVPVIELENGELLLFDEAYDWIFNTVKERAN